MYKKCEYGLIVGRFQPLHLGHQEMIDMALELCNKVVIFIGSSDEFGTMKNPFSYSVRKDMIEEVYADQLDRIFIYPLPDLPRATKDDDELWGNYILEKFTSLTFVQYPDIFIYGSGDGNNRTNWFNNEHKKQMAELILPRRSGPSGTELREILLNDDILKWNINTDRKLLRFWNFLRDIMKGVQKACSMQDEPEKSASDRSETGLN